MNALANANDLQKSTDQIWKSIKIDLLSIIKVPVPALIPSQATTSAPLTPPVAPLPSKWELQDRGKKEYLAAYEQLRQSASTELEKTTFPLFVDFLAFTSVSNLIRQNSNWSFFQTEWDSKLDEIKKEVKEHRVVVRIHAIKTILAATTLDNYEELSKHDNDFFNETRFDDEFFNNPAHFLVCNSRNCRRRRSWKTVKFSSINDLLMHQHSEHHHDRDNRGGSGHFYLPDAVVFALSGIIEVAELDDATVTEQELNDIGGCLQCSNSYAPKKFYKWTELIDAVVSMNKNSPKDNPLPIPTITLVITHRNQNGGQQRRRRRRFAI